MQHQQSNQINTTELQQEIVRLQQEIEDLKIELSTAIEHGDSVDEQLLQMNDQLLKEITDRKKAEATLQKLTDIIRQEKNDLELLVEAVTDHSDRLDEQWLHQYEKMQTEALTDGLTKIPNRRHFNQHLLSEWYYAIRHNSSIALIMIDIDHFKLYNDTYGHTGGDHCLRQVAKALIRACNRGNDFVARYGGEEFVVIISDTDIEGARIVAEKIHAELEALAIEHKTSLTKNRVTASLGVAVTVPRKGSDENAFVSYADHLLYGAKRTGRNRTEIAYAKPEQLMQLSKGA